MHSLVEDFNKISSPRKTNDSNAANEKATGKEKSIEQRSPKQKRSPPKTSPKYTKPCPGSHGEVIVTSEKKMKPISYKQ